MILPGRDYADSSYYRDNIRNHTTASIAFLYSYSTPKLRVQGQGDQAGLKNEHASRLPPSPVGELHRFFNADLSKSFEARLVAFDPRSGLVRVRMMDGGTRDTQFLSLSKEDQEYVKQHGSQGE